MQCALEVSVISGKPEFHPIISLWQNTLKNVTLQIFNFISVSQIIKKSPYGVMLHLSLFSTAMNNTNKLASFKKESKKRGKQCFSDENVLVPKHLAVGKIAKNASVVVHTFKRIYLKGQSNFMCLYH